MAGVHIKLESTLTSYSVHCFRSAVSQYVHHLKGKTDRLQILLQKPHRNLKKQFKTLAVAHVPLDDVVREFTVSTFRLRLYSNTSNAVNGCVGTSYKRRWTGRYHSVNPRAR